MERTHTFIDEEKRINISTKSRKTNSLAHDDICIFLYKAIDLYVLELFMLSLSLLVRLVFIYTIFIIYMKRKQNANSMNICLF